MSGPLSPGPDDARVRYARYTSSLSGRCAACDITATYDGPSRVNAHGPASAVAPAWPRDTAACAAPASADGGSPATWLGSVTTFTQLLVASNTLLEKAVASDDSSCVMATNRAFASPSSPTPASVASRSSPSTTRRCASDRLPHTGPSFSALNASYSGLDCASRMSSATFSGCTVSYAERSASESLTAFRCDATLHERDSGSASRSSGSTSPGHVGVTVWREAFREVTRDERRETRDERNVGLQAAPAQAWSGRHRTRRARSEWLVPRRRR